MEFTQYIRDVRIDRSPAEIAAFVREVVNLPRWTGFFLKVGPQQGDERAVETVMGPARTRIEEDSGRDLRRLTIVSHFGPRRETADIEVEARGASSEVRFHLRLPASLPAERVELQLARLESELRTLKQLIEDPARQGHTSEETLT